MNKLSGALLIVLFTYPSVFSLQGLASSKSREDIPLAPLPAKIVTAKKVFLANGGGNDLAYDAFYAAVREWPRYEIVNTSSSADIIMEVRYATEDHGTRVWSSTANGITSVHSQEIVDPQLVLTVFDPSSKEIIWSTVEHRRLARRGKNRQKEIINAAEKLVANFRDRLGAN